MPEGDTIFRAAATLDRALAGATVTGFESAFPALNRVAEDRPVVGRTVETVRSRGKHLLVRFSGDLILHTHMRMNGSWHVYPAGAPWRAPRRDVRIVIATARAEAVGLNIPIAEFLTAASLARHRELSRLGPDLLAPDFDAEAVLARMRTEPLAPVGDALLNQRVVSGIGNVFKSEILFVAGVYPFACVRDLGDDKLRQIIGVSVDLLRINVADASRTLTPGRGRRTTGRMNPSERLWVYGRAALACRRCGTRIEARATGPDARRTYWCPSCQPANA